MAGEEQYPHTMRAMKKGIGLYVPRTFRSSAPYVLARSLIPRNEDRRVAPSDECPHPEWWTSIDSDSSTEREVTHLIAGLVRGLQPHYIIETGTAFAQTTRAIG